ncbi:MAG: hypothetical protein GX446_17850 [Chthonomonadales bacterium]|nr:hypothetical protein [Chthonomonadales bacterium]
MIRVDLSATDVAIEAGQTAQLDVSLTNKQETDDNIAIEIEGLDVEWYAVPVPSVHVAPGETRSLRVLFKVGRSPDVAAGTYPFVVRARGMESGETGIHQAALTIKPFSALQLDLDPKRATSTLFRRASIFELRITNLGNHTETLDLSASDSDDACAYEFENDRIVVKPGGTEAVGLAVEPRSRPLVGSTCLYQFTATARSASDAYVSASAHGQLERRAILSTVMASLLLVAAIAAAGWWIFRPRPVAIRSFTAEPQEVVAGDPVTLSWDIENPGEGTKIDPGNIPVRSSVGTVTVKPEIPTLYKLVARGGGREVSREIAVAVRPRPPLPSARIREFTASAKRIHQGDVVTLTWRVDGATALVLNPIGELNPKMDRSRQVMPEVTTTYVLSAQGQNGEVVTKSVDIEVVPPNVSIAEIRGFRAVPDKIEAGGKAQLRWTVANAAAVEIDNGIGDQLPAQGQFDVTPAVTTVYTLRASDSKGNAVSKQVTVTVVPPAPQSDEPITP